MKAIYKREVSSYFNSMIGWIFVAVLTVFIGIYFFAYNLFPGIPLFLPLSGLLSLHFHGGGPHSHHALHGDERHTKTDQLLLTAPVSVTAVVLGKYFAMLTVFPPCRWPLPACAPHHRAERHGLPVGGLRRHSGLLPAGRGGDRRGMLISSLTESQIIAAVGTFGLLLLLYLGRPGGLSCPPPPSGPAGLLRGADPGVLPHQRPVQQLEGHRGVLVAGAAVLIASTCGTSVSANLLPDVLRPFSLSAFDSFADHALTFPGSCCTCPSSARCWSF